MEHEKWNIFKIRRLSRCFSMVYKNYWKLWKSGFARFRVKSPCDWL